MGNECSCTDEPQDEIEINTKNNLIKLKKVKVDADIIKKELERQQRENAKIINESDNLNIKINGQEQEIRDLEKQKTNDSSVSGINNQKMSK